MEFRPKILCPICKSLLEFNDSTSRGLEYNCPNGCVLSSEDVADINKKVWSQLAIQFQEENTAIIF
jgi:CxxC motif-containing protein